MADNIPRATSEFGSWQKPEREFDDVRIGRTTQNSWKSFCKMSPTEEQSAAVQDELHDVTTCCICDEMYTDPVILPCTHTFCLACLQRIGTRIDKNPGDPMLCPLCRQEFTIPEDGFAALNRNFFMVRFIEITTKQGASSGCDKHENENLRLYCSDCNEILCVVCLIEFQENHRVSGLNSAADILRSQLRSNVSSAKQCMSDALKKKGRLLQQKLCLLEKIEGFETEVNQIRRDLKELIDRQADSLLENLDVLKTERIEDIEFEENEIDKHLKCLKDFEMCCAELASNDRYDSIFCKMASEMNEQVVELELLNKSIVQDKLRSFEIDFTKTIPAALELYKTKNIIGVVKGTTDYRGKPELVTTIGTVTEGDTISGMAVSENNDVFIVYENNPVVSMYDSYMHACMAKVTLKDFVCEANLRDCVSVGGNVYIVNARSTEILRIDPNRDLMKWSTEKDWGRLSLSAESTLVATCYRKSALKEYSLQGTLLNEIKLCSTIVHPLHAVKLGNGHFVVSHGTYKETINRVCLVNDAGGIIKSFGDRRGPSNQQLECPNCLAVDESGNILVLDRNNSRVLLLSPELEFKRELLTKADGLRRPVAMHLDEKNGQLYIADNNWEILNSNDNKVLVFNVK